MIEHADPLRKENEGIMTKNKERYATGDSEFEAAILCSPTLVCAKGKSTAGRSEVLFCSILAMTAHYLLPAANAGIGDVTLRLLPTMLRHVWRGHVSYCYNTGFQSSILGQTFFYPQENSTSTCFLDHSVKLSGSPVLPEALVFELLEEKNEMSKRIGSIAQGIFCKENGC